MIRVGEMLKQSKPFLYIFIHQFGSAVMSIISKLAMNHGVSQSVLVVYRHVIATVIFAPLAIAFERRTRPKMTASVFAKIVLLALLEPVMDQNLYYGGMKYTTATFATAMCSLIPAFTFIMACLFRLEKLNLTRRHSQAKVFGSIISIGGALLMTLFNGPILINEHSSNPSGDHYSSKIASVNKISVEGVLMIVAACVCCSAFFILQAITLKSYPAELSLTAWICAMGAAQGSGVALALEWHDPSAWSLRSTSMLYPALYSGIFRSGLAYYMSGVIVRDKGPVFVTAFYPLGLVIVAIISSLVLSEVTFLGRVIGAVIVIGGLYIILWGRSNDVESMPTEEVIPSSVERDINDTKKSSTDIHVQEMAAIDEIIRVNPRS